MKGLATAGPAFALWAILASDGCSRDEPPTPAVVSTPMPPASTAAPSPSPQLAIEGLPRSVGSVSLRMARGEVEGHLGTLTCHDNTEGFRVCHPEDPKRAESGLEIFLYHDQVVSLAYEVPPPNEVGSYLETFTARYGKPALNGLTEHDRSGRLHEVYGWRDTQSLYSVRFIWQESPTRHLSGAAITLWDREAYAAWEKDSGRARSGPTPPADVT